MSIFQITRDPIDLASLRSTLLDSGSGGFVSFEGWIRNRHNGREVLRLEYEAYDKLALTEGSRILAELRNQFGLSGIACIHRVGLLEVGEVAVCVAAAAEHRRECFEAVSLAMSSIKRRVPIWKHEFYADGGDAWVQCDHDH